MPVRIQLKRVKGFRLQEVSKALNGLEAVKVARPTKWGNWVTSEFPELSIEKNLGLYKAHAKLDMRDSLNELKGKNLACFCPLNKPCHADILLELANK